MNRKDFLKGIFGAAVITTIPKPVMDRIETLHSKHPIEPIDINAPIPLENIQKTKINPEDGFFYLY